MMKKIMNEDDFDKFIKEIGSDIAQNLEKNTIDNLDANKHEFSERHKKNMQEVFANADKYYSEKESKERNDSKNASRGVSNTNIWRKVLIVAAAMVLIFALAISSVGAWRESFMKYFLKVEDEYSDVKKNEKSKSCVVDDIYFKYIPSGYVFKNKKESKREKIITFENGDLYCILEIHAKDTDFQIDTENSEIIDMTINDKDMVYSEKDEYLLTWNEKGKIFCMYTNDSKDVLMKVVENVEMLDNKSQNN